MGLRAGVRLDIGEARAEQLAGAIDRELLGYVDMFAAAIITLAGIAFGIFVGEDRALGLQHRRGDDVLRRDQFKLVPLAIELRGDSLVHRWIRSEERRVGTECVSKCRSRGWPTH